MKESVVLIPAYQPHNDMIQYVKQLNKKGFNHIVVVDDGSGEKYQTLFNEIESYCHIIHYKTNMGKGYALKTGLAYIKEQFSDIEGIVTVDCDGQHTLNDVEKVVGELHHHRHELVLGGRDFSGKEVPFKSKIGNIISSKLFALLFHQEIQDTQTGLRAFDLSLIDKMLEIPGNRFEYETQQLVACVEDGIPIYTTTISTIYHDHNNGTHFRPLQDSLMIIKVLIGQFLRFISSSIISSVLDIVMAWGLMDLLKIWVHHDFLRIALATVIARIVSTIVNYVINKKYVFDEEKSNSHTLVRFFVLCFMVMMLSTCFVYLASHLGILNEKIAKPIVDSLLFLLSYQVQVKWVFRKEDEVHE